MANPFDLSSCIWPELGNKRQPKTNFRLKAGLPTCTALFVGSAGHINPITGKPYALLGSSTNFSIGQHGECVNTYRAGGYSGLILNSDSRKVFTSTSDATIILLRRKRLNEYYDQYSFVASGDSGIVSIIAPDSGVKTNFVFGSTALRVNYTENTKLESFVFVAGGGRGREVWESGKLLGSSATSTTFAAGNYTTSIGAGYSYGPGDNEEVYLCAVFPSTLTVEQCRAISENPYSIFEDNLSNIVYFPSAVAANTDLSGAAQALASAASSMSTSISIVGASISSASVSGVFNQSIEIAGIAANIAIASGELGIAIDILGDGFAQLVANGAITQDMPLTGGSTGASAGVGDLTVSQSSSLVGSAHSASTGTSEINMVITLSGEAIISWLANADPDLSSSLNGNAYSAVSAEANLEPGTGMFGDAHGIVGGTGAMVISIPTIGAAQATVTGSTGLLSTISLLGSAVSIARGDGDVIIGVGGLTGDAIINALAGGNISLSVSVSAAALARSLAAATMSASGDYVLPMGDYAIDSRSTLYEMSSRTPTYGIRNYYAH